LPSMRIHRQNSLPEPPAGRADHTTDAPARHLRWRPRCGRHRAKAPGSNAGQALGSEVSGDQTARVQAAPGEPVAAPGETLAARGEPVAAPGETLAAPGEPVAAPGEPVAAPGETLAAAMQLAIALLTAGLDSPELEAWAAETLVPVDADGLGDFMAGLHVISVLLLNELHEVTEEPPADILQRLAMLAERRRGTPSAG